MKKMEKKCYISITKNLEKRDNVKQKEYNNNTKKQKYNPNNKTNNN